MSKPASPEGFTAKASSLEGFKPKPLVLVVDDHPMNTKLIAFVVRSRGLDVMTAASADEAWRAVAQTTPDVILMDVQLPGTDGLALTRQLRADARFATLPIVAVTAYAMESDRRAAYDAGCTGFVSKPIDTRALGDLVATLVGARRA